MAETATATTGNRSPDISPRHAALVAGVSLLVMVAAAPYAEFYAYGGLIQWNDAETTLHNITNHQARFLSGIFCYLLTFLADIVAAWAFYVLLRPVHRSLSLLTGWFRLAYAVLSLAALSHVNQVMHLTSGHPTLSNLTPDQISGQVMISLRAFGDGWGSAFALFSVYLVLLGVLVMRAAYIPRILGILLVINGLGYFVEYVLAPFLFPTANLQFLMVTYFGEVILMLWLLIRWRRIPD